MSNYKREKLLRWIDKNSKSTQDKKPLAKLIPIKETITFNHAVK